MEEHEKDPPPPARPPPPGRNRGAKRRRWGQIRLNLAAPPPPPLPPDPYWRSKGPRIRIRHPSQARKETAIQWQLQHGGWEPGLLHSDENYQSGRVCDVRHGCHPSHQSNRHHHTGCLHRPGLQGEEKPPTVQQAAVCTNNSAEKPARRQLPQEAIPKEYHAGTGIRVFPGSDQRPRRRIGQVRQARTNCSATRWEQYALLGRFPPGSGSLDAPMKPSTASWHAWRNCVCVCVCVGGGGGGDTTIRSRGSSGAHPQRRRPAKTRQTRSGGGSSPGCGSRETEQPQAGALSCR